MRKLDKTENHKAEFPVRQAAPNSAYYSAERCEATDTCTAGALSSCSKSCRSAAKSNGHNERARCLLPPRNLLNYSDVKVSNHASSADLGLSRCLRPGKGAPHLVFQIASCFHRPAH